MNQNNQPYALVTGGSRGIGKAISLQLAQMGYHVLINYYSNKEAAEATLNTIEEFGGTATLLPFDVGNQSSIKNALVAWSQKNSDHFIEVLINNAGIKADNLMAFMQDEEWDNVINTNLNGLYWVTKELLQPMILKRKGKIVNIASLSGVRGTAGQVNYSAAKAGVIAFAKALSQEVGPRNITVNTVAPGFIQTDMTEGLDQKSLSKDIPLRRFGTAEEVAHLVSFLVSEKANYITGQVLQINGGLYS